MHFVFFCVIGFFYFCPRVRGAFNPDTLNSWLQTPNFKRPKQNFAALPCERDFYVHPVATRHPSQAKDLLREAESRLSFLRIATPRGRVGSAGATRAVYRDGKVMDGAKARQHDKARHSNWGGGNLDPDSVRHHRQNLARAGFANHRQVLGPHGF